MLKARTWFLDSEGNRALSEASAASSTKLLERDVFELSVLERLSVVSFITVV